MFPIEAFRGTVERFIGILKSLKIRHHLTGGVVSVAWGEPRMTQDIDIVIDRVGATANIERLVSEIQSAGYFADEQGIRIAIHGGKPFQLLDQVEVLNLDVYLRELVPGELSRSVLAEVFPGSSIAIVSRPDAPCRNSSGSSEAVTRVGTIFARSCVDFLKKRMSFFARKPCSLNSPICSIRYSQNPTNSSSESTDDNRPVRIF